PWGGGCQPVVLESLLDAPGRRGADALVDRQCLRQVRGGLAGVAFPEVSVADSLQGSCLLGGRAEVAGGAQRPGLLVGGLAGGRRAERALGEAVRRVGVAKPVAEGAEQFEGPLVAGGGGRVVPGVLLDEAEVVEGVGLAEQLAVVAEQRQRPLLAGGR